MTRPLPGERFLLFGVGVTNAAAARALLRRGLGVTLVDDRPDDTAVELASELGVDLIVAPDDDDLVRALDEVDVLLPAPGLGETHRALGLARAHGVTVCSEFDLAAAWDDRPLVAVTGTNGKTTVTLLVVAMLEASGIPAAAVGNLEVPLVAAIDDPAPDWFVVEASSFRLAHSRRFTPAVAVWLNLAPDHLDVHGDEDSYRRAKQRILDDLGPGDTAVLVLDDPVVAAAPVPDGVRVVAVTLDERGVTRPVDEVATVADRRLVIRASSHPVDPGAVDLGAVDLGEVDDLPRTLPHDLTNSLAAAAAALAAGATVDGVRRALGATPAPPHRVEFVAEIDGVRWVDDSKSTAPHATLAAVAGFDAVVLVAGGRNKGLDLSALAAAGPRVRAVVGIGESGPDVVAAFPDRPSAVASSMAEAVEHARSLARPGDTVLLSPACASFDWYGSYAERGRDFASLVRGLDRAASA
ncbi:MAG: UDP-N-acetylmuramoyl-L-alanine--D-glutamate ligase [Acidobacteria bacterium]|nr:UDP-N-acetylmuramoyl-L-alanine--D-glutamate ligase [Acidobacteriota bacterium]